MKNLIKLINDNEIDKAMEFIRGTSSDEFNLVVAYLLKEILSTRDGNVRNTIAYLLGELKCQEAAEVLIELIFNEKIKDNRGTLISALGKLECTAYIYKLLPLLYEGNYEVVLNTYALLQNHFSKIDIIEQKKCVAFIAKKIECYEDILTTLYDVHENIFGEELED